MIPVKDLRYGNVVKFRNKFVPECYTIGVIMTISSPKILLCCIDAIQTIKIIIF